MKRSDLISLISSEYPELSKAEADRLVRVVFGAITDHLATGGRVELRGFGVFDVKRRDGRQGRNPRTGGSVSVPEKRVMYFRSGKTMRDRLNPDKG